MPYTLIQHNTNPLDHLHTLNPNARIAQITGRNVLSSRKEPQNKITSSHFHVELTNAASSRAWVRFVVEFFPLRLRLARATLHWLSRQTTVLLFYLTAERFLFLFIHFFYLRLESFFIFFNGVVCTWLSRDCGRSDGTLGWSFNGQFRFFELCSNQVVINHALSMWSSKLMVDVCK